MTAQEPDVLTFNDRVFSLIGWRGKGLFHPSHLGVSTIMASTACRRGFRCYYAVRDERLVLERLGLMLGRFEGREFVPEQGPSINGVEPLVFSPERDGLRGYFQGHGFTNFYQDLSLEVPFTGRLIVGTEPCPRLERQYSGHSPWLYKKVLELHLAAGRLDRVRDLSRRMAIQRILTFERCD